MDMQTPELLEKKLTEEGMTPHSEVALACLLDYAPGASVALPVHSGVELIEQPRIVPVPGMPACCLGLLTWQGRQLPLIDLRRYLDASCPIDVTYFSHVLVVAYQTSRGMPIEYGALCAPFLIRMIEVADSQQCASEASESILNSLSISCFQYQGRAVPVIEPARLFSRPQSH